MSRLAPSGRTLAASCWPLALMLGYVLAAGLILPPIACPLKFVSGRDCPTCGTTRSVFCILTGDWQSAFAFNPVGFVALAACIRPVAGLLTVRRRTGDRHRTVIVDGVLLALFFAGGIFHFCCQAHGSP